MLRSVLLLVIIYFVSFTCGKAQCENSCVYRVSCETQEQLELLQKIENSQDGLSFFDAPVPSGNNAEIVVPPHRFTDIIELLLKYNIKSEIKISNLQRLIDSEQPKDISTTTTTTTTTYGWEGYYDLPDIYNWLDQMLEKSPNVLTNYNFGYSFENRTLRAVKLSHKTGNPTIFIESTIHSREWITVATATYILNELLTSNDVEVKKMAKNYDWIFVPVLNVDGYAYTHSHDRMWRKSRQPHSKECIGADLNRNFEFHHAEVRAMKDPCAEDYPGPTPFSEPEISALSEFIKTFDNLKLYISFHSYSQFLLFPHGFTKEHVSNYDDLNRIAQSAKEAMAKRYGTQYTAGSWAETMYISSGTSLDWVYATQNVSLCYTIEFRDKGKYGFLLPPDQIIPNSLEVLDGLKAMVREAQNLQYL